MFLFCLFCYFEDGLLQTGNETLLLPSSTTVAHIGACVWRQRPGPGIMATYVDILKSEFPEIDTELFDYITGKRPTSAPP